MVWQHRFAVWSGILGSTASCIAKVALSSVRENDAGNPEQDTFAPMQWFHEACSDRFASQEFDAWFIRKVHLLLGELMVKHGISLMARWKRLLGTIEDMSVSLYIFEVEWCTALALIPRLVCLSLVVLFNIWMVLSFVKGLEQSGSIIGTALSTASNFIFSAVYGHFIWKEMFPDTWWIGFAAVLVGVLILSTIPNSNDEKISSKPRKYVQKQSWKPATIITTASATTPSGSPSAFSKYLAATKKKPPSPPTFSPPRRSPNSITAQLGLANRKKQQEQRRKLLLKNPIIDRWFVNQCPLCDNELFDPVTGLSPMAVTDLSPNCFHMGHSKCLKQQSTPNPDSPGRGSASETACCPVCDKAISMWINSKQAAHFAGFWIDRVEKALKDIGPVPGTGLKQGALQPVPAKLIRERLRGDDTLRAEQKRYIDDDPTGLGKGLMAALEWGGYVDYNGSNKGRVGWSQNLRSKGMWKYTSKYDDLWLWEWGAIHPRQRCEGCQLLKRPLPIECQGCSGSSECAFYCSEICQRRDWQRHKMMCEAWQRNGPASVK